MTATTSSFQLHPTVDVVSLGPFAFEFFDRRTGFRFAVEDVEAGPELQSLLARLGLLEHEAEPETIGIRQHRFRQTQAWDERLERTRSLLSFVNQSVPFYRDRQDVYSPAKIRQPQDLLRIPLLSRKDLHAEFLDLCVEGIDYQSEVAAGRLELAMTSGTTAQRIRAFSDADLVRIPSNYHEIWNLEALDRVPKTAVLTSATCLAEQCTLDATDFASRLVHGYTLYLPAVNDLFSIGRSEVERIALELHRFAPELLLVNPVYAHWFGRAAKRFGVELPRFHALISSYQYLSLAQRRGMAELFDAPVFNQYSATELGGCQAALECRFGSLHIREDHCLLEFLDHGGVPVSEEIGALVVTTLENRTMPLVRYGVGDLGQPRPEPCACALEEWPSFHLHGRERDALVLGSRWFTTKQVDDIVGVAPGVDFYTCRQLADGQICLDVIPRSDADPNVPELRDTLGDTFRCGGVRVNIVKRLQPAPSMKYPPTQRAALAPGWFGR